MTTRARERLARTVCWFSAGAPSAVAAKLKLAQAEGEVMIAYTDPGSEHPDNERFIRDWRTGSARRSSASRPTSTRHLGRVGADSVPGRPRRGTMHRGAEAQSASRLPAARRRAGVRLHLRQRPTGSSGSERATPGQHPHAADRSRADEGRLPRHGRAGGDRAARHVPTGVRQRQLHRVLQGSGFGYWNRIRRHFPEVFDRMAKLERDIGHSICSEEVTEGSEPRRRCGWTNSTPSGATTKAKRRLSARCSACSLRQVWPTNPTGPMRPPSRR